MAGDCKSPAALFPRSIISRCDGFAIRRNRTADFRIRKPERAFREHLAKPIYLIGIFLRIKNPYTQLRGIANPPQHYSHATLRDKLLSCMGNPSGPAGHLPYKAEEFCKSGYTIRHTKRGRRFTSASPQNSLNEPIKDNLFN